jgi:hypothetical protein
MLKSSDHTATIANLDESTVRCGSGYSIRKAVITPSRIGTMLPTYRLSSATTRLCSRMKAVARSSRRHRRAGVREESERPSQVRVPSARASTISLRPPTSQQVSGRSSSSVAIIVGWLVSLPLWGDTKAWQVVSTPYEGRQDMVTSMTAASVPVPVDVVAGEQVVNGLLEVRLRAATSLDQCDPRGCVRNKDVTQSVAAVATEPED